MTKSTGNKIRFYKRKIKSVFLDYIMPPPLEADIEPINNCNLSCVMCQTTTWKRTKVSITTNRLKRIIKQIPSLKKVKLQGMGEPFLHPNLFELIKILRDKNIEVTTVTNGILVKEKEQEKLFKSGINRIYFSVDTLNRDTYKIIRSADKLDIVLENLKETVKNAPKNLEVCTMTVAMKNNINELLNLVEYIADTGVRRIAIQTNLTGWGKEDWESNTQMEVDKNTLLDIIGNVKEFCTSKNITLELINNHSLKLGDICTWPFYNLYITADGYVQPCCRVSDPSVVTMGNIYKNSFESIWNGKEYRELRKQLSESDIPSMCKMCYTNNNF